MKLLSSLWHGIFLLGTATAAQLRTQQLSAGERPITQVVKLLQDMLEKSKAEADTERDLYAKYKCYCDTNEEEKSKEIERLEQEISMLEAKIEELRASSGELSRDIAQLKQDKAASNKSQDEATAVRAKEASDFSATSSDLSQAIGQMCAAIKQLANVGGDQTKSVGADHTQYMAGYKGSLLSLRSSINQALTAASAFVTPKQASRVKVLLQAPFTGNYASQSGEVVGILKDMNATFTANLDSARKQEEKAIKCHAEFMATEMEKWATMDKEDTDKTAQLGCNDNELGLKTSSLSTAKTDLVCNQDFLAQLLDMCKAKKTQYDERVSLRTNEAVAISQAISILNSDAAFETFGTVSATSSSAVVFLQHGKVRRHLTAVTETPRKKVQAFLERAAGSKGSPMLGRVVAMLQAQNPFAVVLEEIDKMLELLKKAEKADDDQKKWCDTTRGETSTKIDDKSDEITTLKGNIARIDQSINDPVDGLLVSIQCNEDSLASATEAQKSQTQTRREENVAYQQDIANLVEAQSLLKRAVTVLQQYYSKVISNEFAQTSRSAPEPPSTWDDKYAGQSEAGSGVIQTLEVILQNAKAEEDAAHKDEMDSQHSYEDSMQSLTDQIRQLSKSIAKEQEELAKAEESLMQTKKSLSSSQKEKASLEAYLEKIAPGCDFITANIDLRKENYGKEKNALIFAKGKLKETPIFKEAVSDAHKESLGECLGVCEEMGEAHVECKACLADVSVPGYCAGHPGTVGC